MLRVSQKKCNLKQNCKSCLTFRCKKNCKLINHANNKKTVFVVCEDISNFSYPNIYFINILTVFLC